MLSRIAQESMVMLSCTSRRHQHLQCFTFIGVIYELHEMSILGLGCRSLERVKRAYHAPPNCIISLELLFDLPDYAKKYFKLVQRNNQMVDQYVSPQLLLTLTSLVCHDLSTCIDRIAIDLVVHAQRLAWISISSGNLLCVCFFCLCLPG